MTIKSMFFNAVQNGNTYDRVYSAEDFSGYLDKIVGDGVFASPSVNLQVIANNPANMAVYVHAGQGWIQGHKFISSEAIGIDVPAAHGTSARVDSVNFYLDYEEREMGVRIVTGTPGSSEPPALRQTSTFWEYRLARVAVGAGATSISQSDITDRRGTTECPFVAGLIEEIDAESLFAQWDDQFNEWIIGVQERLNEMGSLVTGIRRLEAVYTTSSASTVSSFDVTDYIPEYSAVTDFLELFINGLKLTSEEYTLNGTTVTLTEAIVQKRVPIDVVVWHVDAGGNNYVSSVKLNGNTLTPDENKAVNIPVDDTLTEEGTPADAKKTGDELTKITKKLVKFESHNLIKSDSEILAGYVAETGVVYEATTLFYTPKIPVSEGDVVQYYNFQNGAFSRKSMRFVCAYDSNGTAVSAKGTQNVSSYTVPEGISYVVITSGGTIANTSQHEVTLNYSAPSYEEYFEPYYIASEEFIEEALKGYEVPETTVKGYNLISDTTPTGSGYYYGTSVGSSIKFGSSSTYKYAVIDVKPNTDYYFSFAPRFWAFTNDANIVTSYGESPNLKDNQLINSGNGTKFYYSDYVANWNMEEQYGIGYAVIVSEGGYGSSKNQKRPSFVSGISQNMMDARFGCCLPHRKPFFTVGKTQMWFKDNYLAIPTNHCDIWVDAYSQRTYEGISINPGTVPREGSNGYLYCVYDDRFSLIAQHNQTGTSVKADNPQSCSALVIGDSTVAQNTMTQKMMDEFTAKGQTLTLIGTRGTSPNLHEGRAGWSAKDYCTSASKGGTSNPFFNTGTNAFDFSYYMNNQGYTAPDFVVIQLGINDLYNASFSKSDDAIEETCGYILEMVQSVWSYNANQKILLNLPTAMNSDQSKHSHLLALLRNMYIRYNDRIQYKIATYNGNLIRVSHCHLILNPSGDILDGVHPNTSGYTKMAEEVVSQINCWQQA